MTLSRRAFLAGSVTALATAAAPRPKAARRRSSRSRLILLATGGGPRPRKERGATAHAVVAGGSLHIVDCGNGVARQIVSAGLSLPSLRHVFITHHHSDHNADYGNLLLLAWTAGLRTRVDTWGPPPLEKMTRLFFEMNAYDIDTRIADEARVPLVPLVFPHEITGAGTVMEDETVRVSAALADHPPVRPAFAYRFDCPDRSIVFSGDTRRSDEVIRLAQGADVLVHEAMYPSAVGRLAARVPGSLAKSILSHHTSAQDAGRVAAAARVKTLVLSHLVPADDPAITDSMWIEAARPYFGGTILVAKDGMEL